MSSSRLVLAAVGDISFARRTAETFHRAGPDYLFAEVRDDLAAADLRFGNFESVLVPRDFPLEKCSGLPLFSYDDVLPAIQPLRFDILHIASNHILDCGWRGLLHTQEQLSALGAKTLGAGVDQQAARQLQIIEKKGMRIGFLGYLQAGDWTLAGGGGRVAYLQEQQILQDIELARPQVDVLVLSIHADIEFQPAPSMPRLKLCRKLAEAGPDLILCHHPHVPQGVEKWHDCLIHYSLGNFLFDINGYQLGSSPETKRSHIFYVDIEDGKITGWRRKYLHLHPDEGGRPKQLSAEQAAAEESYYQNLDQILTNPQQLQQLWYKSCRHRLELLLQRLQGEKDLTPELFLHKYGKSLFSDMSNEYLAGIWEMAAKKYAQHATGDFEYKRPFAPYEQ